MDASSIALRFEEPLLIKLKELITHQANCVTLQLPDVTAAKFYPVNTTAIFTIINMLATYTVAIVQFHNN